MRNSYVVHLPASTNDVCKYLLEEDKTQDFKDLERQGILLNYHQLKLALSDNNFWQSQSNINKILTDARSMVNTLYRYRERENIALINSRKKIISRLEDSENENTFYINTNNKSGFNRSLYQKNNLYVANINTIANIDGEILKNSEYKKRISEVLKSINLIHPNKSLDSKTIDDLEWIYKQFLPENTNLMIDIIENKTIKSSASIVFEYVCITDGKIDLAKSSTEARKICESLEFTKNSAENLSTDKVLNSYKKKLSLIDFRHHLKEDKRRVNSICTTTPNIKEEGKLKNYVSENKLMSNLSLFKKLKKKSLSNNLLK